MAKQAKNKQIKISIQPQDFILNDEVNWLESDNIEDGATVTFCGRVRQKNLDENVSSLFLEHYPGMTEKTLKEIIIEALSRWQLGRICVIHRVGKLNVGEQIVFVGVTSPHRKEAYAANEFIMDFLKVEAPFWKKEVTENGEKWLDANKSDHNKASQWHLD